MSRPLASNTGTSTAATDDTLFSNPATNSQLSASAFELLLIELVPLAYRLNTELDARHQRLATQASLIHLYGPTAMSPSARRRKARHNNHNNPDNSINTSHSRSATSTTFPNHDTTSIVTGGGVIGGGGGTTTTTVGGPNLLPLPHRSTSRAPRADAGPPSTTSLSAIAGEHNSTNNNDTTYHDQDEYNDDDDDDDADPSAREAAFHRLTNWGHRVGQGLVERFSAETARPNTPLDAIKFVCKDLWTRLYRKQIDNLKTNHRGTFVLTDNRFAPIGRVSADRMVGGVGGGGGGGGGGKVVAGEVALRKAQGFLWFHCGIVRGALAGFGMVVEVHAETTELPVATFQIKVVK